MSESAKLLKAHNEGAVVVCDAAPYKNRLVAYEPRHKRDPQPWTVAGFRYSGHECKAISLAELRNRLEGR